MKRLYLDSLTQLKELQKAVASMGNNKAPGTEGLQVELYNQFGDILRPKLLSIFQ